MLYLFLKIKTPSKFRGSGEKQEIKKFYTPRLNQAIAHKELFLLT